MCGRSPSEPIRLAVPQVVVLLVGTNDLGFGYYSKPEDGEAAILREVQPTISRYGVQPTIARYLVQPLPAGRN